ncbi:hypothetical protein GT037_011195, partial [Alternaria burnsii]
MATGTRLCGAPKPSLTTTSKPATLTPQARRTFQESFDSFEKTVQRYSRTDDREFSNTTLRDVRNAAKEVERHLAARQCMRNMKRLEPFLNGLEAYSKVIEVLCNGTPFLSWIWLATDHISAFEKLLAAYSQIAAMLPRVDRLGTALQDKPDFQQALAVVYSDILTFHEHAYKLFRRNGWICFFKSSWGQFGSRFNCILDSLAKHATLIDQEANAYLVSETMLWRREALQVVAKTEKDRSTAQLTAALSWLGLETVPHCGQASQDNLLDRLIKDCCDGTTDWILKHQRMRQWLQNGRGGPILWLKGKPGSGKSTLCAKLVHFLRAPRQSTVLFCFYSYIVSSTYPDPVVFILATLVSQVLRQRTDLATYVYEEFVAESRPLSIRNLQELLSNLLPQLVMPRILIDGIDECIRYDMHGKPSDLTPVKDVLASILQLESPTQACAPTKILVVSRDILEVVGKLSKRPTVALDQESDALTADITRFATKRLETIRERFESLHGVDDILQEVKKNVVSRSQGMFLWVRLVLLQLEDDADNLDDLENAVANMPHSLHDFYARIVHRIMLYSPQSRERTINILKWMLCSRRPLRVAELQDAVVFASGAVSLSERSKLPASIVDRCRPLVQTDDNEQISFVHFTVQEYLTKSGFISLRDAERCTTITCLNYLTFSLELSNPNISARRKAVGVGKCLYTLQPYVHEHWLDHLLAFAAEVTQSRGRQLEACLEVLLSIYSHQYVRYLDPTNRVQPDILAARNLEPRLRFLEHYEHHYKFLCVYVSYRHAKQVHFEMPDDYNEPLDPTPLSVVQFEYAKQVDFLLSADTVPGLTPEELTMFKLTNCPYAFVCRFPGCSGMLAGFSTQDLRAQHETTHKPTFFCMHSGCTYKLPFASRQSLGRHIRTFHNSVPESVPKSIRRRRATRSKDRDDHAGIPKAAGDLEVHSQIPSMVAEPWTSTTASLPDIRELDRREPVTLFESVERYPLSSLQTATAPEFHPDIDEEVDPPDSGPTKPFLPKLPAGWIAQWDNSSQKYYYVQITTGISQWELPSSYKHYRRADGQMKEYPSGNEYSSDPPAETQRFLNASNQTRTQSGTVETTRNEGFGGGMKLYPYPPSAEHNSAAGNNKAAVNSWLVNESITRSLSTSPDARPKFLEVPGLPPSRGDLGSPPSWGIQYNTPLFGRDRPYDPDHPYDPGEPDEDYPSGVPRAKEPLP